MSNENFIWYKKWAEYLLANSDEEIVYINERPSVDYLKEFLEWHNVQESAGLDEEGLTIGTVLLNYHCNAGVDLTPVQSWPVI